MAPAGQDGVVYSATYSNVPVYELNVRGNHVMRRRADDWINATHILKVAELDKPARTRVLEKEVQLDIHEKVQGGYGKYQGTWIPQDKAEQLAKKYKVDDILRPILMFKLGAGDRSPPPAPKHTTAASSRPKAAKPTQPKRPSMPIMRTEDYENLDNISDQLHDNDSPDNSTVASDSIIDDDHHVGRKRKRDNQMYELSHDDQQHTLWADSVLDYFMLTSEDTWTSQAVFPGIPPYIDLERPVDSEGHTALHWAAAMGDIDVCKDLIRKMANTESRNLRGETPLIRAAIFANCFDRGVWPRMLSLFEGTVMISDDLGGTILHHICYTTTGSTKSQRARHYLEVVLARLKDTLPPDRFNDFASSRDRNGDTPFHIACRLSRRCTKVFQAFGLPSNIRNNNGETVDFYLHEKAMARRGLAETSLLQSSSPVTGDRFGAISPSKLGPVPSLPISNLKTTSSQTFNRALQSLMATQVSEFLQVGEAELQAKENVLNESKRALQRAEADGAATRNRIEELQALNLREESSNEDRENSYRNLLAEAEKLEEQIQHRALHKLVHQEETSPAAQMSPVPTDLQDERQRKLRALREITSMQTARQEKTRAVVAAMADAGMGPKGEQMKGIILQTLAVSRENLEEDVDALIEHMEPERGTAMESSMTTVMDLDAN